MKYSPKRNLTRREYDALAGILRRAVGAVERRDRETRNDLSRDAWDIVREIDRCGYPCYHGFTHSMVWAGVNDPALLVERLGLVVDLRQSQ